MPAPRWLKACWQSSRFCGQCVWALVQWILWILLVILAGVQIFLLTKHELNVPQFVLREVESRLADAGLHAKFGKFTCDPTGHLLVRDVRISLLSSDATVMRAKSISLQVDPVALWLNEIDPSEIRFSGIDLMIPAVISPSGQAEPIIAGLDAQVRRGKLPRLLDISNLTAQVGPFSVSAFGQVIAPSPQNAGPVMPFDQLLRSFSQNYLRQCQRISKLLTQLPGMQGAKLEIQLTPHPELGAEAAVDARAEQIEVKLAHDRPETVRIREISLTGQFLPGGEKRREILDLTIGAIEWQDRADAHDLQLELSADWDPTTLNLSPANLTLSSRRISAEGINFDSARIHASLAGIPVIQSQGSVRVGGGEWSFQTDIDATNGAGRINLTGEVGDQTLKIAAHKIGFDVPSILSWSQRPVLAAKFMLGPGGKPLSAEADLSTGPVNARWVPLDSTSAHVTWRNHQLRADQIVLRRGDSLAFGSYDMNTADTSFRFLLNGQLVPSDINGWFRDWWPRLFAMFNFQAGPPRANVEVSGRWKAKLETQIFISADADNVAVKDIPMQRMRTRLFVRPGWVDVLNFISEREPGTVQGRFARQWHLPDSRRWTRLEIHAGGRSDLSPVPKLLRENGEALIDPFTFNSPLDLRLDGAISREEWGQPTVKNFTISGQTNDTWRYKNFPLQGVSFQAEQQNDQISIDEFTTGLGGGELKGKILLTGSGETQKIGFDVNLEDASLGRTIQDVVEWTASRKGERAAAPSNFQKQMAAGTLTLSLSAEGPADDPFDLKGTGSAAVFHPDLADLNLLGPLSVLLKRTLLNFSTLKLSHANANFELSGPTVKFPELKVSGDRGALDANGTYSLETKGLNFTSRVRPFEGGEGLLDAVFTPFSSVLEVKLAGQLSKPEWTFVYGPTNILRNITGENNRARPGSQTSTPNSPKPPEETTTSSSSVPLE